VEQRDEALGCREQVPWVRHLAVGIASVGIASVGIASAGVCRIRLRACLHRRPTG
jgi:hypothetical protein